MRTGATRAFLCLTLVISTMIQLSPLKAAYAQTGTITLFPTPASIHSDISSVTTGPDGALWFTEDSGTEPSSNKIGRITVGGVVTEYPIPTPSSFPQGITSGPDGNLWFVEMFASNVAKMTPDGLVTEFPLPGPHSALGGITTGSDGNMWVTNGPNSQFGAASIDRITPAGSVTEFPLATGTGPWGIVSGPDGNLWFTDDAGNSIGRITTAGVVDEFPLPTPNSRPVGISEGAGRIWFTEDNGPGKIGSIDSAGNIAEFPIGSTGGFPFSIAPGSDGNMWFTEGGEAYVGRITPNGVITQFLRPVNNGVGGIAAGPDGNMWFGSGRDIARIEIDATQTMPPVASFVANPSAGTAPLVVSFMDTSSGNPTSFSWDFGDRSSVSASQNPTHTYETAGTFVVTETATNAAGSNVAKGSVTVSPPPDTTPPTVTDIAIAAPTPADRLLSRGLTVHAADTGGSGLAAIEYVWSPGLVSSPAADLHINTIPATALPTTTVSYADSTPNAAYTLFVRAVDGASNLSAWKGVQVPMTPSKPILVALGDSITSGHHKDGFGQPTICNDKAYGYPEDVWLEIQATLPAAWKGGIYDNFARSGASSSEVIKGGMDACKARFGSQTTNASADLQAPQRDSWNTMVMTVGVDDTNWVDVLGKAHAATTQTACQKAVDQTWNLPKASRISAGISTNVATIVNTLRRYDPSLRVALYGYYNVAGTGTGYGLGPVIPNVCDQPFETAMNRLQASIRQRLDTVTPRIPYTFVASDNVMHGNNSLVQGFYADDAVRGFFHLGVNSGWPHPNSSGAFLLGAACADPLIAVPLPPCF